jgi:hypothetical protein
MEVQGFLLLSFRNVLRLLQVEEQFFDLRQFHPEFFLPEFGFLLGSGGIEHDQNGKLGVETGQTPPGLVQISRIGREDAIRYVIFSIRVLNVFIWDGVYE